MIISRNIINEKITYLDYNRSIDSFLQFSYDDVSKLIDAYKNLFLKRGFKKGSSVVIGNMANVSQLALIMACAELGIIISIVDNPFSPHGTNIFIPQKNRFLNPPNTLLNKNFNAISNKYRLLLPVDLFVVSDRNQTDKFDVFYNTCRHTIVLDEEKLDYTPNNTVFATDNTIFLKCTSSGTSGTPKVITHTHNFLYELIKRNSKDLYGKMGWMTNLAHGSSPAVYVLPGLVSKNVTHYVNMPGPLKLCAPVLTQHNISLDHVLVPYTLFVDEFFDTNFQLPNCIIHTLGLIRNKWVEKVKEGKVKDIISIFGTNETSGPILINQATDVDFAENSYKMVDEFYKLNIVNNILEVTMPVYETSIPTFDKFYKGETKYFHGGRSNLYRINDLEIDLELYQNEISKLMKANLIVDTQKDSLYLAIWETTAGIDQHVKLINEMMRKDSKELHTISKTANLIYSDYLNGVKLDMEMLREYFRNH